MRAMYESEFDLKYLYDNVTIHENDFVVSETNDIITGGFFGNSKSLLDQSENKKFNYSKTGFWINFCKDLNLVVVMDKAEKHMVLRRATEEERRVCQNIAPCDYKTFHEYMLSYQSFIENYEFKRLKLCK
jgi:hypothetical protein